MRVKNKKSSRAVGVPVSLDMYMLIQREAKMLSISMGTRVRQILEHFYNQKPLQNPHEEPRPMTGGE